MTILYFAVTLGLLIAFHEFGHFWVARRCGVKVHRFSIGFGPALLRWRDRFDTDYVLAAIPLGGYVKMLDEREGPVDPAEQDAAFNRQSAWARAAIVSAGPLANFILAIAVYWVVMLLGVTSLSPVVGEVEVDSIAYRAGIEPGQEIIAVNGRETPTREQLRLELVRYIGETTNVDVKLIDPQSPASLPETATLSLQNWLAGEKRVDVIAALGLSFYYPPWDGRIGAVLPDGAAAMAGLQAGDRLLSIDGRELKHWRDLTTAIEASAGNPVQLAYQRGDANAAYMTLTPQMQTDEAGKRRAMIGVQISSTAMPEHMIRQQRYGAWPAVGAALNKAYDDIVLTLDTIGKMLKGLISPSNISGPVSIAKIVSASAETGLSRYLQVLALLSISLGVINLLPVPVLDGGHLLFIGVESLIRRPIPERIQIVAFQVGLLLVVSLMVFAIYNDIVHY